MQKFNASMSSSEKQLVWKWRRGVAAFYGSLLVVTWIVVAINSRPATEQSARLQAEPEIARR